MDLPHRSCIAGPPSERPRRHRQGARVVVRAEDRVLLTNDTDPGLPDSNWWVTPGGGVDPGETFVQAAVRELREETGLLIGADQLVGPVARRRVGHGYSDQVLIQTEQFFIVDLPEPFAVDTSGYTPEERQTLQATGWFTLSELGDLTVWPAQLASLVVWRAGMRIVDWGDVEESTVPLLAEQRPW
jgi:8-oxo-dGTP pyrophosphatase MutT (NUDIX family)